MSNKDKKDSFISPINKRGHSDPERWKSKKDPDKVNKRGRPSKVKASKPGELAKSLEDSVKNVADMAALKILSNEEIKEEIRQIMSQCLNLMKQHFKAISLEGVKLVDTPNGPKKMTIAGFPKEDLDTISKTIDFCKQILMGDESVDNETSIDELIKQIYKPMVSKDEYISEENKDKI